MDYEGEESAAGIESHTQGVPSTTSHRHTHRKRTRNCKEISVMSVQQCVWMVRQDVK